MYNYTVSLGNRMIYLKAIQSIFWLVGIVLLLFLWFRPPVGVTLLWNILIPVAPALLVVATGVWRNICPLATTALFPNRFGFSRKKDLSTSQRTTLNLLGITLLFLIIPLRHLIFNRNGQATALVLISVSILAFAMGYFFKRKSGWCSGLCPVHNVEKLYGSGVAVTLPNAHCKDCVGCSVPCPDSTNNYVPVASTESVTSKVIEFLLVGAFPGYIWGWFQVPDYLGTDGWQHLHVIYGYSVLGGLVTTSIYLILRQIILKNNRKLLISLFAAAAVSCYYWFRLPLLFGFSPVLSNGMLIDLTHYLPASSMIILNLATTGFFLWWMVIRKKASRSWSVRPIVSRLK